MAKLKVPYYHKDASDISLWENYQIKNCAVSVNQNKLRKNKDK